MYIFRTHHCPGFGHERVNFHQRPERDTATMADPSLSNKTVYLIPCAVMLGSRLGELGGGKSVEAWKRAGHRVVRVALCVSLFVFYILLICIVVITVHFIYCPAKLPVS